MGDVTRYVSGQVLDSYHPFDIVHGLNPEIIDLANLDSQGLVSAEMRPLIATFRTMEAAEKIAAIRGITEMHGFDVQLDIAKTVESGKTQRTWLKEEGMTRRTGITQEGMTERVRLHENGESFRTADTNRTILKCQKLKYEFGRAVAADHYATQRYLSDNELQATIFEAQAQAETIRFTESLRNGTLRQLSADRLVEEIRKAEIHHATLIRQAEEQRMINRDNCARDIAVEYISNQAQIFRDMIQYLGNQDKQNAKISRAFYQAVERLGQEGIKTLASSGKKGISIRSYGQHGELNMDISLE